MSTYGGSSLHEGGLYVVWVVAVVPDAVIFLLIISVTIEHRCPCLLVQTMSPVTAKVSTGSVWSLLLLMHYFNRSC